MNCTGKRCIMQHDKVDPATCPCVSYCPQATPPKTNADRHRSMSDEEFATAICKHDGCPFREAEDDECLKHHYDCKACWLGWLKEEGEEGDT